MTRPPSVHDMAHTAHLGDTFTRQAALAAGITAAQLRSHVVTRVFRGVYTLGDATSLGIRATAALTLTHPKALVCETTGLALLGVALPGATLAEAVHVWVPTGVAGPAMAGIQVHWGRLRGSPKTVARGLRTVAPAECWLQAARRLSVQDLVILADGLMRRQDPILFADDLRAAVSRAAGRRGIRRARTALELAREGTDSPMETVIRLALVDAGLPCPEVNHPLLGTRGTPVNWLDMAYPDAMVAVEYDGAGHAATAAQVRRDQTRRRSIEDRGWRLITATADDLANLGGLVASVRRALDHRSVRPHDAG